MSHFSRVVWGLFIALAAQPAFAQSKSEKKIISRLKQDIGYLASDELEGRATGSAGERKAGDYLIRAYRKTGIAPYGKDYRHEFSFVSGREIAESTEIRVSGNFMRIGRDAFPLPFTGSGKVAGEVLPEVKEQESIWLVPLYQSEDEAKDAHFDWEKYAWEKSREAERLGATGILFYDAYNARYPPAFNPKSDYDKIGIPAAVLLYDAYLGQVQNLGGQLGKATVAVEMNPVIRKTEGHGTNIAAYLDNGAAYTVVIGAHYDHLGYGDDAHSLYRGEKQVHNGADDNASGTAALIQLAERIKKEKLKHYNYLFLHFSGEELGLLGSKAIVRDLALDSSRIAYMINMDMVGRLNDSTHALTIGGVGTSPAWGSRIVKNSYFRLNLDSSGVGPSDHSSFYHAGVPVLFFFSGTHKDYHKPGDDADKINYGGMVQIMQYVFDVVKSMDGGSKPVFTPTRQVSAGKVRFKVTLGIIPDYSYQEEGVRADGVSDGKPAQAAGIRGGDVIIRIGDHKVSGMQTYMEALGAFNPGDKTEVTIRRGDEEKTLPLEFK